MSDENEIDLMMATPEQLRQTALYKTSPERIGLAIGDELEDWDSEFSDSVGDCVTWFAGEDPPVQVSIGYVRADLYDRLRAELAKVREQPDAVIAAWASPNVLPLRGNRDNHHAILTATKCAANTVPVYLEPPVAAPAMRTIGHPDMILDEVGRLVVTRKYADAQMVELVRQIAQYPATRSEEMSAESIRARCRFAVEQYDAAVKDSLTTRPAAPEWVHRLD